VPRLGAAGKVARYLAPAALLLVVTAVVLVVGSALRSDVPAKSTTIPAATKAGTSRLRPPPAPKQYYVIRSGDTLEGIASRLGTTVTKLLQLNPGVEPTALTPGTHVRVR